MNKAAKDWTRISTRKYSYVWLIALLRLLPHRLLLSRFLLSKHSISINKSLLVDIFYTLLSLNIIMINWIVI